LKKERVSIPKPSTNFLLVQCTGCGGEQVVFSAVNTDVKCKVCDTVLAEKTGGKAEIHGVILRRLD